MVAASVAELGGADILVNNAGIQHVAKIADFPEKWDAVIAINLSAAFHAMQAAMPHMTAKGWGRIINIASAHGLVASGEKAAYVTAKHGLVGLTKVIAIEAANDGVTCNAICPGWVLTALVQKQIDARAAGQRHPTAEQVAHALLREKQPMPQYTTPEKIGGLAVFLCTDAARTMTGAPLRSTAAGSRNERSGAARHRHRRRRLHRLPRRPGAAGPRRARARARQPQRLLRRRG